jgi:L-ribulokinase
VAKDGIIPGLYGYEAGQPAVGDMFGWFAENLANVGGPGSAGGTLRQLEQAAAALAPGQSGLVVLDWWNGNRSVLADADLSGVIAGLTLQTSATDIYRALLESVAFGNKAIMDNFASAGLELNEIVACGGIAEKSPLLMQVIADVSGRKVSVPSSSQVPARGSALFGAVAAGAEASGFSNVAEAAGALRPGTANTYHPRPSATATYERVYRIFKQLHDTLGRDRSSWLHGLKQLKRQAARPEV